MSGGCRTDIVDADMADVLEQVSRLAGEAGTVPGSGDQQEETDIASILAAADRLVAARPRTSSRPRPRTARHSSQQSENSLYRIHSARSLIRSIDKASINSQSGETDDSLAIKLNCIGNCSDPIISPKLKNNDMCNRKLNFALEELKDARERLKSVQMQYDALVKTHRQTRTCLDEKIKENQAIESKLSDNEDCIANLKLNLDALKSENGHISSIKSNLKEELNRFREDKKNMSSQINKDRITIQDLQRQCKEMENILIKRYPDSVSALIVASKHKTLENDTKTFLEKRISELENEVKNQERNYQNVLSTVQEKVKSMKDNYETHITDLEKQVINLQLIKTDSKEDKTNETKDVSLQTDYNSTSIAIQTLPVKPLSARSRSQPMVTSISGTVNIQAKEDTHLMATVRGLNLEIAQKDKNIAKLNKELEESKKSIVKLHKSKEVPQKISIEKSVNRKQPAKPTASKMTKSNSDTLTLNTNKENNTNADNDKNIVKFELDNLQIDYENLKKKRIDDLVELQTAHEKELMNLNMKVLPLQKNIETLNSTVETLRDQIKTMDEQLSVIVKERDHFKCLAEQMDSNFDLIESGYTESYGKINAKDYDMLRMKVMQLEKRYEGREVRLKTLINSLAKLKDVHSGIANIESISSPSRFQDH